MNQTDKILEFYKIEEKLSEYAHTERGIQKTAA